MSKLIDFTKLERLQKCIENLKLIEEDEEDIFVNACLERIKNIIDKMNLTKFKPIKMKDKKVDKIELEVKDDKQTFAEIVSRPRTTDEALMRLPQTKAFEVFNLQINELTTKEYYVNFQCGTYHWMYLWTNKGSILVKDGLKIHYQLRVNNRIPEVAFVYSEEWKWMRIGLVDVATECYDEQENQQIVKVKLVKYVPLG